MHKYGFWRPHEDGLQPRALSDSCLWNKLNQCHKMRPSQAQLYNVKTNWSLKLLISASMMRKYRIERHVHQTARFDLLAWSEAFQSMWLAKDELVLNWWPMPNMGEKRGFTRMSARSFPCLCFTTFAALLATLRLAFAPAQNQMERTPIALYFALKNIVAYTCRQVCEPVSGHCSSTSSH